MGAAQQSVGKGNVGVSRTLRPELALRQLSDLVAHQLAGACGPGQRRGSDANTMRPHRPVNAFNADCCLNQGELRATERIAPSGGTNDNTLSAE